MGQAPSSSVGGLRPVSDGVVVGFPSGCSGSAGPSGLSVSIGSCLQVAELGVYFAHDKVLFFWLVARQDL